MEILGIGPSELAFIVIIALILLGPKDMVAAGRTLGKTLRKIVTSPMWKAVRTTGQELQQLPTKLMREAQLDDLKDIENEIRDATQITIDPRRAPHRFDGNQTSPVLDSPPPPAVSPEEPDAGEKPDPAGPAK